MPTVNFTVRPAGAKISGTVYDSNTRPLSDLDAWVYARKYSEDDEFSQVLADVPLTSKGTFTFPSVPGKYWVGVWLPPGSGYSFPSEKIYSVKLDDDNKSTVLLDHNDTVVTEISFTLAENDSIIAGKFSLGGSDVTGLTGEVYAIRVDGDGWQSTAIEDNGTYELVLAEGTWALDYYIEADASDRKIPAHPSQSITVKAVSSSTVSQDFTLRTASASISGKAIYESNGSAVVESTLYVWAYREGSNEYWDEVETDENGTFSISVLPGGFYEVGAILPEVREDVLREPRCSWKRFLDWRQSSLGTLLFGGRLCSLNIEFFFGEDADFVRQAGAWSHDFNGDTDGAELLDSHRVTFVHVLKSGLTTVLHVASNVHLCSVSSTGQFSSHGHNHTAGTSIHDVLSCTVAGTTVVPSTLKG